MLVSLPMQPPEATPIGERYAMQTRDGATTYFCNLQPIDCHRADDRRAMKLRIARLHVLGCVRQSELSTAFDVSPATVARAVKRYRDAGEDGFFEPRRGRGRTVIDPQMARKATELLAQGMSGRAAARTLGVSPTTFNENRRSGVIAHLAPSPHGTDHRPTAGPATDRAARDARDQHAPMGRAARDVEGRTLARAGLMSGVEPAFHEPANAVARAGVLAALPMLLSEGLLGAAHRMLRLPDGYYGLTTILLFVAFMTLARVRNPESLRYQAPGEWGALLGLDRCPEVKTLRRKLAQLADSEHTVRDWQAELARRWAQDDPHAVATLAVDGHVKVYTGRKGKLPKHFIARQKLCLPAAAGYWVNALGGLPLLCLHTPLDPKMVKALEHDVVPALHTIGVLTDDAPDLTAPHPGEPALTVVFDREGWSPALFKRLARQGIAVITWHKNFKGEDWPEHDFRNVDVPLHGPAHTRTTTVSLAEKPLTLPNALTVRQLRRRLDNARQVPLITTHPTLSTAAVAGAMFSRWSQENFFKYMREEFNLDALPTHALEPLDPDTEVVNPLRRTINKTLAKARSRLASLRNRLADAANKGKDKVMARLAAQAHTLERDIDDLKHQRGATPTHVRAGDLPEGERLDALPTARRLFLDIIRMLAYRAETRMMPAVCAVEGKARNPRTLLRTLLTSDANIIPEPEQRILRVQILGLANNALDRALAPLLEELNATQTIYPGTDLRLVYEMSGDPRSPSVR